MSTRSRILSREEVLANLAITRQKIVEEASKLSDQQREEVFLGIWSIKDLLAHLIGWDKTNRRAAAEILEGKVPFFYEHRDRDWQTYNAMLVKKYRQDSFEDLLSAMKASQEKLIEFVQTIPPESFNKDFGVRFRGYKVTIQRLLEADIKDVQTHLQQIRDYFQTSK
jgi:hypothetical protein